MPLNERVEIHAFYVLSELMHWQAAHIGRRHANILVSEQLLQLHYVVGGFQKVHREGMPELMEAKRYPRGSAELFDQMLQPVEAQSPVLGG